MLILLRLLLFLLVFVAPCVAAAWLGSRVRWTAIGFVIAWITTPIATGLATVVLIPLIRAATPANNDGTAVLMFPFLGTLTGLFAGTAAAIMIVRRNSAAKVAHET